MVRSSLFRLAGLAVLLAAAFGCAGIVKLKPEERGAGATKIQELSSQWESYAISAAIWPGYNPVALLFDSRSDDGIVLAEGWTRVQTREELTSLIGGLQAGQFARLFQVLGPDGHLFGYLYAAVPGVQTQVVDSRTVRVYPIKPPPAPGP
ncbi:MAG: hypothetical protein ACM34H_07490 [Deltaproteobacteria bacterium]